MDAQRKVPMLVAAIIAVVGQTVILFNDFGLGNNSQGRGNARMITVTAVSRAGAIEIPSELAPPVGRYPRRGEGVGAPPSPFGGRQIALPVCTENLDADVVMMKPSEDRV